MALNYLGITNEPVGGGGAPVNIEVPPGSGAVFLSPPPANAFDYKYIQDQFEAEVEVSFVDNDPTAAENFDALFALLNNEVVSQLGDFNSTAKTVTAFAEWSGLSLISDTLHEGNNNNYKYLLIYRLFVDVV